MGDLSNSRTGSIRMQMEQVWHATLGQLQLEMTKATFETWVRDTVLLTHEDGTFVVGVPNAYAKDWLENRLLNTVKRTLTGMVGHSVEVRFVVWPTTAKKSDATPDVLPQASEPAASYEEPPPSAPG